MPVDLRGALRGALDVVAPPFEMQRVRARVSARLRGRETRRARSMFSLAAFVAVVALFAGGHAPSAAHGAAVAALPAPAPAPQAT